MKPEPWGRLPGESDEAYAAFLAYRDLGTKRSLDEVARRTRSAPDRHRSGGESGGPRAGGGIKQWSRKHRWVERASAWDDHRDGLRDGLLIGRFLEYERRRLDEIDAALESAARLRAKGLAMLRLPHVERVVTARDARGAGVAVTIRGAWADYLRAARELIEGSFRMAAAALDGYRGDLPEGYAPDVLDVLRPDAPPDAAGAADAAG